MDLTANTKIKCSCHFKRTCRRWRLNAWKWEDSPEDRPEDRLEDRPEERNEEVLWRTGRIQQHCRGAGARQQPKRNRPVQQTHTSLAPSTSGAPGNAITGAPVKRPHDKWTS
ncbi:hypothetical protein niasHT_031089 [Heterodera trifolii]|uniref:Uncharacterized protein n=1 Tax=Heterodera trifolii TaxID=157864 RepID=A0ABD2IFB1_9BILA